MSKTRVDMDGVKRGMMAEMWDWGQRPGCSPATVRVAVSWYYRGPIKRAAIAKDARKLGYAVAVGAPDGEESEKCGREIVRRIRMFGVV